MIGGSYVFRSCIFLRLGFVAFVIRQSRKRIRITAAQFSIIYLSALVSVYQPGNSLLLQSHGPDCQLPPKIDFQSSRVISVPRTNLWRYCTCAAGRAATYIPHFRKIVFVTYKRQLRNKSKRLEHPQYAAYLRLKQPKYRR